MKKRKNLKCFISAPTNVDLSNIKEILESHDVDYIQPVSNQIYLGMNFQNEIRKQINDADFILAILKKDDFNVIHEIGMAHGMSKKIFVIIPEKIDIPSFILDTLYLRTDLSNINAITFAFEPFLNSLLSKTKKSRFKQTESKTLKKDIKDLINQIEDVRKRGNKNVLLIILQKVFTGINADIIKVKSKDEFQVDMSIWLKEFENIMANPAIIEIKCGTISEKQLRNAEIQLSKHLERTNAKSGFILYLDRSGKRFSPVSNNFPNIFRFDVSDLIYQLSNKSFLDIILKNRDITFHLKGD